MNTKEKRKRTKEKKKGDVGLLFVFPLKIRMERSLIGHGRRKPGLEVN